MATPKKIGRLSTLPHSPLFYGLLSATIIVALTLLLPPIYLIIRAAESGGESLSILTKASTIASFGRTIWLSFTVTVACISIAVPVAWLTTSTNLPLRKFWTIATALPLVLPSYIAAYLFISILGPKGVLQKSLLPFGVEALPSLYGFWGAFIVLTLLSYPYILLTVRAALRRMDPSYLEAGRSLGLNNWQVFWRIILPQLRPSIVAGSLLVSLYVMREFGAVSMLRYDTFTRIIYIQYQSFSSRALSATLALVLVVMTGIILYLDLSTRGRASYNRQSAGSARRFSSIELGKWKWPALIGLSLLTSIALFLPAGALIYWLIRGLASGEATSALLNPALGSLTASFGAAIVTALAALPVALIAVRYKSRISQLAEQITYIGFALPSISLALALTFFAIRFTRSIYQTVPLLIIGYTILFIPQAFGATRSALLQLPKNVENAGRSLGHSSLSVFTRVTLPLVAPGVLAGATLVFLTAMKELPATLILSPLGFDTLAIDVWANISEAFFAKAAAPSLLLILLSSIPLAILTLREK